MEADKAVGRVVQEVQGVEIVGQSTLRQDKFHQDKVVVTDRPAVRLAVAILRGALDQEMGAAATALPEVGRLEVMVD